MMRPAVDTSPERARRTGRHLVRVALVAVALTGGVVAEAGVASADATPQPTVSSNVTASASASGSTSRGSTGAASAAPTSTPAQGAGDDRCAVLPLPVGCDSPAGPIHTPKIGLADDRGAVLPPSVRRHGRLQRRELPRTGAPIGPDLALGLGLAVAGVLSLKAGRSKQ